jgi:glutathione S-transferase
VLRIVVGNKRYSSWSLRGWLAVKQSGLPFEEVVVPMFGDDFEAAKRAGLLPSGKVPTLWDGETPIWDSLAIIEYLADRVGRDAYWPFDDAARALARSMAAEMHSGFAPLRQQLSMNLGRRYPGFEVNAEALADIERIVALWTNARERFGASGPYLFGQFGAADIMYAPVVTRFVTYDVALPEIARAYVEAMAAHPWMREWQAGADAETIVIDKYEF